MMHFLWIIPYPEMASTASAILAEHAAQKGVTNTLLFEPQLDLNTLNTSAYDAIIARGYATQKLRAANLDVPVIDIAISAYDVIHSIHECTSKYAPKRIAFIGFYQAFQGIESLSAVFGCKVRLYEDVAHDAIDRALDTAVADGCDAILSGYSVYQQALRRGLNSVLLKTWNNALIQAHDDALHFIECAHQDSVRAKMYQIITQSDNESVIFIDENGIIQVCNESARHMLNGSFQGGSLAQSFPELHEAYSKAVQTGKKVTGELSRVGNIIVSLDSTPVIVNGQVVGGVLRFRNVQEVQHIESQLRKKLSQKGLVAKYHFSDIVYRSETIRKAITMAQQYARAESNVLIVGETGTGKELFAQSVHNESPRRNGPFVAVNCAALPESLLESELFGHVEGAFTGTMRGGKMGLFELAHNGTLFLDEISEISTNMQGKLLRVLQEREVRRIGDDKVIAIDVRIIAATNRNLSQRIDAGTFRRDLLYRLDTLKLYLPPLRQRPGDMVELFRFFLACFCRKKNEAIPDVHPQAFDLLQRYPFPGNARELHNIVERVSVVRKDKQRVTREDLEMALFPEDIAEDRYTAPIDYRKNLSIEDKKQITSVLAECGGNQLEAARRLGINRVTLWRKLKKLGITHDKKQG